MQYIKISVFCLLIIFMIIGCGDSKGPNIIYILADDLGYGDLGCYGQQLIQTPNIDRLAEEGIRFTQHYAGNTVCAPSRCALLTGMHTGHTRIRGNKPVALQSSDTTIAELLKNAGYKTGIIGKWGLGDENTSGTPNKKGFDYFFGYLNQIHAHNYYPDFLWENAIKVWLKNKIVRPEFGYAKKHGSVATKRIDYSHDLFTDKAVSFIRQNSDEPFFLYLAYTIPHANNESHILDQHGMEAPDYGQYSDKDWPDVQKGYASMITRMDNDIGVILFSLKELGIDQNTIVMFSSDNGPHDEGGNDPGFFNSNGSYKGIKRDFYEGGIRVPFIVRWPGKVKPGMETGHVSAFWDVLPTFCEIAQIDIPEKCDGISFLPTLLGENQPKHDYLYWEFHWWNPMRQALRQGNWKLVSNHPDSLPELYDLENDVQERDNLASKTTDKLDQMILLMKNARTTDKKWPLRN